MKSYFFQALNIIYFFFSYKPTNFNNNSNVPMYGILEIQCAFLLYSNNFFQISKLGMRSVLRQPNNNGIVLKLLSETHFKNVQSFKELYKTYFWNYIDTLM